MAAATMRIAEEYFQRLLWNTPALKAVSEISGMWMPRLKRGAPWLGLTQPEHDVFVVEIYVGEVGNGGHTQFFLNHGGASVTATRDALRITGLDKLVDVLDAACALLADGVVPVDQTDVERVLDGLDELALTELDFLDRQVWNAHPEPDTRLLEHLRLHEREVLCPERGLVIGR